MKQKMQMMEQDIFILNVKASYLNLHLIILCCNMHSDLGLGRGFKQNVILQMHAAVGTKFITQSKQEQYQISTSLSHLVTINTTSHESTVL